jgi:putative acetyltransferase
MIIRLAEDKDYAAIARLHRGTIKHINSNDYPEDVISVWAGRTSASRYRNSAEEVKRWVAVEKNKIVGFCDHDFKCDLGGLYVHKDFQGKGVGKKLLDVAEASMKKMGCKKITIMSTVSAKTFYEKNDYEVVGTGVHRIEDKKVDVLNMVKIME